MERTSTWENIGTSIINANTVDSVLEQAGLDYQVSTEKIFTSINNKAFEVPNKMATIREDGHIYGVVSDNYQVIQNKDAFDFVNYLTDDVTFKKAGETSNGMIYIISSLPDVNILGDNFTPYVIFRNSFNGLYAVSAAICPLRIVCQNQFNIAFKDANNTVNIKHSSKANDKLIEARHVLAASADYMKTLNKEAEKFANIRIDANQMNKIVDELFPIKEDMNDRQKNNIELARNLFAKAHNCEDNQNFKNTLWGVINAYSDYISHKPILRNTEKAEESRFISVSFDPRIMNKLLSITSSIAA